MRMRCRIFPHAVADGPANMALDEAMLDAVAGDPSCALLRTYGWAEPTLSLGYFQRWAEVEADPRWRGVPVVRRPSGGGAIWHHHELTYALALPAAHPLARPSRALYQAVHAAIAAVLNGRGAVVQRCGPLAPAPSPEAPRPFLCFTGRDPDDLVCEGAKLVGSAQRRRHGAILQHGSVVLAGSPITPELLGLHDLASSARPVDRDPASWSARLLQGLPPALGLDGTIESLPDALERRARELDREVYRNHAWNRRR